MDSIGLVFMGAMFVVMYFFMIMPQQRKAKKKGGAVSHGTWASIC